MARNRKGFLGRMAEALNPPTRGVELPAEIPFVDPIDRIVESLKKRVEHTTRLPKPPERGLSISLPGTEQKLYFRPNTPQSVLDAIRGNQTMLERAARWSSPGGQRFDEFMFWREYHQIAHTNDNPNLMIPGKTWEDIPHYFDWVKWKAQYNAINGKG